MLVFGTGLSLIFKLHLREAMKNGLRAKLSVSVRVEALHRLKGSLSAKCNLAPIQTVAFVLRTQQMAEIIGQTKQNISLHINNCFKEKELSKNATVKESLTTDSDGK